MPTGNCLSDRFEEGGMSWVSEAVEGLAAGRAVRVRPFGGSMRGRIESGQLVTLAPVAAADVTAGDVVFLRWKGRHYLLHLVLEVDGDRFLIGNNLGKVNGWADWADILGRVEAVGEGEAPAGPGA
jgi:hypothetical protein